MLGLIFKLVEFSYFCDLILGCGWLLMFCIWQALYVMSLLQPLFSNRRLSSLIHVFKSLNQRELRAGEL